MSSEYNDSEFPRERLARFVTERRRELDLTQDDVAERGGPSDSTLSKIESATGPEPSRSTLQKLDQALGWGRGSSREIMRGGRPLPLSADELEVERRRDPMTPSAVWLEDRSAYRQWQETPEGMAEMDRQYDEHSQLQWLSSMGEEGTMPAWVVQRISGDALLDEIRRRFQLAGSYYERLIALSTKPPASDESTD